MGLLHFSEPTNKPSSREVCLCPRREGDTALIISAGSEQSLGQRWFHLQVTLRVLDAPQSALGVHRTFKVLESRPLTEPLSSNSPLILPIPGYSPSL